MQLLQSNPDGTNPQIITLDGTPDAQFFLDYALKCSRDGDGHLMLVGAGLDKQNVNQRVINAVCVQGVMISQNLIQDYAETP